MIWGYPYFRTPLYAVHFVAHFGSGNGGTAAGADVAAAIVFFLISGCLPWNQAVSASASGWRMSHFNHMSLISVDVFLHSFDLEYVSV